IESLIPVLDDLAAAREHGDLADGPFAAIADKLEAALGRLGWSSFGAPGDGFDPQLHEALMSQPSAEVTEPTVQHVAQPGHKVGERIVRPARVIVAQPE
ncbi:MAG: nucleotide exchange factor GrpE, partial [Actinomycetes bacterium]